MARDRILVAPLDWGLGHATRCIPVIAHLLAAGRAVVLGGSGDSLTLLSHTFPGLPVLPLPGYRVHYAAGRRQIPGLVRQMPRLLSTIREEHQILKSAIPAWGIDAVISDNRYGLWTRQTPCVTICHQWGNASPRCLALFHRPLFVLHRRFLRRFDRCWVPDFPEQESSLAGCLAHSYSPGAEIRFIGPLSRFANAGPAPGAFSYPELADSLPDAVAVLSGPEPQRSMLEALLLKQAADDEGKLWIVQGLPGVRQVAVRGRNALVSYMDTGDLHRLYTHAPVVISRPGYSSLMDFHALGIKRMILIPTPGQTEQEYLAAELTRKGVAPAYAQQDFHLTEAIGQADGYGGFAARPGGAAALLRQAVDELLFT